MIFTQGQIQDMLSILKKKEGFIKQTKFETKSLKEEIQKVESDFQNQLTKLLGEKFPISKVSIGSENATITKIKWQVVYFRHLLNLPPAHHFHLLKNQRVTLQNLVLQHNDKLHTSL